MPNKPTDQSVLDVFYNNTQLIANITRQKTNLLNSIKLIQVNRDSAAD